MNVRSSRGMGQALMGASALALLLFLAGAARRSYLVLAIPVGIVLGALAGLGFWVGYTMAATRWEDEGATSDVSP